MSIEVFIASICSLMTLASAGVVALSRNLLHSAFALLGVFTGVLGLYVLLSADFVAVIQLVVYIGGILVLILFAVMLTTKIGERKFGNYAMAPVAACIGTIALGALLIKALPGTVIGASDNAIAPTTAAIGELLLGRYLLPFEMVSLLLVLVLVGAVVLARREVK